MPMHVAIPAAWVCLPMPVAANAVGQVAVWQLIHIPADRRKSDCAHLTTKLCANRPDRPREKPGIPQDLRRHGGPQGDMGASREHSQGASVR